ncbi:uncharacterized protein E0L32_011348 [Thyridium curvatum]|uniref:Glutamate-1-semialdehyde 2,1-aminomutase n=1 Tax=Thyridium curvatum TaxID=1093900 RepID=A0A507B714_9PEZI|nr:uncharacterized protein E0L32_011348 [Thyridium curvatum]TPX18955.1 hypothetical protein E0L32_011348 [Thyridium curvatum]
MNRVLYKIQGESMATGAAAGNRPPTAREALDAAIARFQQRNALSLELHRKATKTLPGGNTRTQVHTTPFPVYMSSGTGYQVTSEDGHTYTDLVAEVTVSVYGHSNPVIRDAITTAFDNVGLNLGATTVYETTLAEALCSRYDLEQVRFTNSGTEANLHALVAARAYTGKRKIVVLGGGYHGGLLIFRGGEVAVNNVDQADWIVARFNDLDSVRGAIQQEGVAAVLVEGLQGVGGAVPASVEFMRGIEASARDAKVLFILDEVMTSRLAPGGLASIYGLKPDIMTLGKALGGGLAFGAFGGRADILSIFDPRLDRSLPHHGTFNNNTLAMIVGHAGLTRIFTPEVCKQLNATGDILIRRLAAISTGTKMSFTGIGSIIGSHFTQAGLQTIERETPEVTELKDLFWYEMMEEGFWVLRDGRIALMIGTPQDELEKFVRAVEAFLQRYGHLVQVDQSR